MRAPAVVARQTDRQTEFWAQTGAAQIGAHSRPCVSSFFIALLQVYPGNSKARPLLKPTTVKVTGNCGTALVKGPVCLQLVAAPLGLDAELETGAEPTERGTAWRGVAWHRFVAFTSPTVSPASAFTAALNPLLSHLTSMF